MRYVCEPGALPRWPDAVVPPFMPAYFVDASGATPPYLLGLDTETGEAYQVVRIGDKVVVDEDRGELVTRRIWLIPPVRMLTKQQLTDLPIQDIKDYNRE